MADAEEHRDTEDAAVAQRQRQIQAVFGDDSDDEPAPKAVARAESEERVAGAGAGDAAEDEPALATKRTKQQSLRDKLQLLAQGKKAEAGA